MLRRWNNSIANKITWINMLVSGSALVLACTTLFAYDLITFRKAISQQLSIQAQILASSSLSALLFDDPAAAQKTLSALQVSPHIVAAGILREKGQVFSEYR